MESLVKPECSICNMEFDTEDNGGMIGLIGILPVNLCKHCYDGMVEMVEVVEPNAQVECPECGHGIKLRVDIVDD